jgi:hypothetical protein
MQKAPAEAAEAFERRGCFGAAPSRASTRRPAFGMNERLRQRAGQNEREERFMHPTTLLAVAAATLLAIPVQAATSALAAGKTGVESSVTYTAGKKTSKTVASKPCGTFMYRKDGKCVDARTKK